MDTDLILSILYKVPLRPYNHINHITMKSYTSRMVSPVSFQQCGFLGGGNPWCTNRIRVSLYPLKWYPCAANEAGPPPAFYRKASHLHTCMAQLIHYQRFQIPKFLYKTVTSFDLIYSPWRGGQSCWKKGLVQPSFQNAINIKATQ